VRIFAGSLSTPYCGANTGFEAAQWLAQAAGAAGAATIAATGAADEHGAASGDKAQTTESIALLALRDPEGAEDAPTFGLLVMGSSDPRRFHEGMATDFLTQIGALASAALSRLLPR
jgi:uncharacterized protein